MLLDWQGLSPWAALVSRLARKQLSTVDSLSMNLSLSCWRRGPPDTHQTRIRSGNAARDTPLDLQRPAVDRLATGREGTFGFGGDAVFAGRLAFPLSLIVCPGCVTCRV